MGDVVLQGLAVLVVVRLERLEIGDPDIHGGGVRGFRVADLAQLDALAAKFDQEDAKLGDEMYKEINAVIAAYGALIDKAQSEAMSAPDGDAPAPAGPPDPNATPATPGATPATPATPAQ